MMKKIFSLLVILLLAGGGYYYYNNVMPGQAQGVANGNPAAQQGGGGFAMPVMTAKIKKESFVEQVDTIGTLKANEVAEIRPEVSGIIKTISFDEGAPVEDGQDLIEIDSSIYRAELNRAKASYDLAKITYERRQKLKDSGYASVQENDEAESSYREAKASYELARIRLAKTKIKSPFSGIAGFRSVSIGDYVDIGQTITDIADITPMKVEFSLPEKYFSRLKQGLPITLSVDSWPNETFDGEIYAVDSKVDPVSRNIGAKALINNDAMKLRPGMFAYVNISFGEQADVLTIPEEALIPQGESLMVMKVVNGKVEPAMVKTGARQKGIAIITEGLSEGDEVITAGHMKVGPGMDVQPMNRPQGAAGQKPPVAEKAPQEQDNTPDMTLPTADNKPSMAPPPTTSETEAADEPIAVPTLPDDVGATNDDNVSDEPAKEDTETGLDTVPAPEKEE